TASGVPSAAISLLGTVADSTLVQATVVAASAARSSFFMWILSGKAGWSVGKALQPSNRALSPPRAGKTRTPVSERQAPFGRHPTGVEQSPSRVVASGRWRPHLTRMAASSPPRAREVLPSLLSARDRPLRHVVLGVLTLVACTVTFQLLFAQPAAGMGDAFTFALCLLLILGSHEMGHWFLARHHGVDASLPYFIPTPLVGFGTLGAVIRLRGRIPDRRALVDIGASGPLAGLVVAIPLLIYGLAQSPVVPAVPSAFAVG